MILRGTRKNNGSRTSQNELMVWMLDLIGWVANQSQWKWRRWKFIHPVDTRISIQFGFIVSQTSSIKYAISPFSLWFVSLLFFCISVAVQLIDFTGFSDRFHNVRLIKFQVEMNASWKTVAVLWHVFKVLDDHLVIILDIRIMYGLWNSFFWRLAGNVKSFFFLFSSLRWLKLLLVFFRYYFRHSCKLVGISKRHFRQDSF